MKSRAQIPELEEPVEAHARAILGGDQSGADAFVASAALESHRAAFAEADARRPLQSFELLARAKIGRQYICKVRFHGAGGILTLQGRWRCESDGKWRLAEIEDLGKHVPWAGIPRPRPAKAVNQDA
jgi:hypothetical protein